MHNAYLDNGVVFACSLARALILSEMEFKFQRLADRKLFGTEELEALERPWVNGSTGELMTRAEQDVTTAGNVYLRKLPGGGLERLRPDWVTIVTWRNPKTGANEVKGYIDLPDGPNGKAEPRPHLPGEIVHWSPIPDPLARFRGMSWITPVAREVLGDRAMSRHKLKFFDNAATPPIVVAIKDRMEKSVWKEFVDQFRLHNEGEANAYKTLMLNGAADITIAGGNMEQIQHTVVQSAGENRICVASGIPAIVVGLKEGMQAATYSNYQQASRRMGDLWFRPTARGVCTAFTPLAPPPAGARLWYDPSQIAMLRQDAKDEAEIRDKQAQTIKALVEAGYTPDSVVTAVEAGDWSLLVHTGLFSVQLRPAGSESAPTPEGADE